MEKKDFAQDTRYAVTLSDENGKLRAANIYVYRLYGDYMIARMTDKEGLLRKIKYADVVKIVKTIPVNPKLRFMLPEAVLKEDAWKDRTFMMTYSSSPALGK